MSHTTITAGLVAPAVVLLVDAPAISVNATLGNDFRVMIFGDRTVANPTGGVDGQRITFQVTQGAGAPFELTWSSAYKFGVAGLPVLSKVAGSTDVIGFIYNQSLDRWLCVGTALGLLATALATVLTIRRPPAEPRPPGEARACWPASRS
jgi:hypothetical protein